MVNETYRTICNVAVKDTWPETDEERIDEATGEVYYTPRFTVKADHKHNEMINRRVARIVNERLEVRI